ncbi:hypothetical protein MKW94_030557 [Papaver nudicaule]|uniref:Bifunctional inhibitor/plant lipid transfer protein/seed storage helical domain-containing protein n=1 Tax=Papaver nudicaule TaxID=74823 RepID=A0AA41VFP9_PAPNU|nr:hypothetical protein [Papaver nudicaule]
MSMLLLLLSNQAWVSTAVICNPVALSPCLGAMVSAFVQPSIACCTSLRDQKPCLCQYLKDQSLQQYINSPNAKKVGDTCGVPFPTNC